MSAKTKDVVRALLKKGFIEDRHGNHVFYTYRNSDGFIDNRVRTKISHGNTGTISEDLLLAMRREMRFERKDELIQYIACTYTLEMYRDLLKKKGLER